MIDEEVLANALRLALTGDKAAYTEFLTAVTPQIRRTVNATAKGLSTSDKEDIVQEVLIAIHTKKHTWRQDHPVKPWCNAIARYKVVDCYRKLKPNAAQIEDHEHELAVTDEHNERDHDIEVVVSRLNHKEQSVVRALCLEGKSITETAGILSMSENNVRVTFHRALKNLTNFSERLIR